MHAVKHGDLRVRQALLVQHADALAHPGALLMLVSGVAEFDLFAFANLCPQRFFHAAAVIGYYSVGRFQDIGSGAVILLQFDHFGAGKILLKLQDIADIRTPPAVNGLVVIAYNAQVLAFLCQQAYQGILGIVGILVFIDVHIGEAALIVAEHRRVIHQKLQGFRDQVIEIERVGLLQRVIIGSENIVYLL